MTQSAALKVARPHGNAATGLSRHRFRSVRPGPENDLVEGFLAVFPITALAGNRLALFQEPRLSSGFPDLVAVEWSPARAAGWNHARDNLRVDDIRLLHALSLLGAQNERWLQRTHGKNVGRQLTKLQEASLVVSRNQTWRARSLRTVYAARRIVSFEAKLTDWRTAIEQATINRWFATESYVLFPALPKAHVVEAARAALVGIWVLGESRPTLKSPAGKRSTPVSYASWLFNEWVLRTADN